MIRKIFMLMLLVSCDAEFDFEGGNFVRMDTETKFVTIYDTIPVYDTITRKIHVRFLSANGEFSTSGQETILLTDKEHLTFGEGECLREIIFELK